MGAQSDVGDGLDAVFASLVDGEDYVVDDEISSGDQDLNLVCKFGARWGESGKGSIWTL